jgi:hypothetical protein
LNGLGLVIQAQVQMYHNEASFVCRVKNEIKTHPTIIFKSTNKFLDLWVTIRDHKATNLESF